MSRKPFDVLRILIPLLRSRLEGIKRVVAFAVNGGADEIREAAGSVPRAIQMNRVSLLNFTISSPRSWEIMSKFCDLPNMSYASLVSTRSAFMSKPPGPISYTSLKVSSSHVHHTRPFYWNALIVLFEAPYTLPIHIGSLYPLCRRIATLPRPRALEEQVTAMVRGSAYFRNFFRHILVIHLHVFCIVYFLNYVRCLCSDDVISYT